MNQNCTDTAYSQHMVELLSVFQEAIRIEGFERLKNHMIRLIENSDNPYKKELEIKILMFVAEEFNISVEELMNSSKRGNTVDAKKVAYILFKNELGLTEYKIAKYFNRTPPIINRAKTQFEKMEGKVKKEKVMIDAYNKVIKRICQWKEEVDAEYKKMTTNNSKQ